jgi:hypothetical protein
MNRALIFCIAIFFAVVGLALMGADNAAVAGHGCCGCHGGCGGCYGHDCCGCHGYSHCEPVACGCCGNGYSNGYGAPADAPAAEAAPPAPAAPAAPAPSAYRRAPAGFRTVSFRR